MMIPDDPNKMAVQPVKLSQCIGLTVLDLFAIVLSVPAILGNGHNLLLLLLFIPSEIMLILLWVKYFKQDSKGQRG